MHSTMEAIKAVTDGIQANQEKVLAEQASQAQRIQEQASLLAAQATKLEEQQKMIQDQAERLQKAAGPGHSSPRTASKDYGIEANPRESFELPSPASAGGAGTYFDMSKQADGEYSDTHLTPI